jgi:hypothetical protein
MVRLCGLRILQNSIEQTSDPTLKILLLDQILHFLLDKNDQDINKRYYVNSVLHRKKLRISQALLLFQPYFSQVCLCTLINFVFCMCKIPFFDFKLKEQNVLLLNRLLSSLSDESLQPSVRYIIEWIIVRVLVKHLDTWTLFFSKCVEVSI